MSINCIYRLREKECWNKLAKLDLKKLVNDYQGNTTFLLDRNHWQLINLLYVNIQLYIV